MGTLTTSNHLYTLNMSLITRFMSTHHHSWYTVLFATSLKRRVEKKGLTVTTDGAPYWTPAEQEDKWNRHLDRHINQFVRQRNANQRKLQAAMNAGITTALTLIATKPETTRTSKRTVRFASKIDVREFKERAATI